MPHWLCPLCIDSTGVNIFNDHPYCSHCGHRVDVMITQCDCPLCGPVLTLPGPDELLAVPSVPMPDLPSIPAQIAADDAEPHHAKFGEYLSALLAMAPVDFETNQRITAALTEAIIQLCQVAAGKRGWADRLHLVEQIKTSLCATLEVIDDADD